MTTALLDGNVTDQNGGAVPGALIYVYDGRGEDGGLSDLFDSLGQPLANPVTSGEDGYWSAYAASDQFYTLAYYWGGRKRYVEANVLLGEAGFNTDPNVRADLASTGGAGMVGTADGGTVQSSLNAKVSQTTFDSELGTLYPERSTSTYVRTYGDSIADGSYPLSAPPTSPWRSQVSIALGGLNVNRTVPGGVLSDIAPNLFNDHIEDDCISFGAYGFNDIIFSWDQTDHLEVWRSGVKAMLGWQTVAESQKLFPSSDGTLTGTWSVTGAAPYGSRGARDSSTAGDTWQFKASGRAVYLWTLLASFSGKIKINVDGQVYQFNLGLNVTPSGLAGSPSYTPGLIRIGGLPDGEHTVIVQIVTGQNHMIAAAGAGAFTAARPLAIAMTPFRMSATGYPAEGVTTEADGLSTHRQFAAALREGAAQLIADGANLDFIDTGSLWNPNTVAADDDIHPPQAIHDAVADALLLALKNRRGQAGVLNAGAATHQVESGRVDLELLGSGGTSAHTWTRNDLYWWRQGNIVTVTGYGEMTAKDGGLTQSGGTALKIPLVHKVKNVLSTSFRGRQGITLQAGSTGIYAEPVVGTRELWLKENNVADTLTQYASMAASGGTPLTLEFSATYECVDE